MVEQVDRRGLVGHEAQQGADREVPEATSRPLRINHLFAPPRRLDESRALAQLAPALVAARRPAVAAPALAALPASALARVALARALASDANLLLFDEPLGALDALTRLEMQALIERLWLERRFSAILVTHDVEEAVALADRILLMEGGRVTFQSAVSLERPRDRASAEFTVLKEAILERILGRGGER